MVREQTLRRLHAVLLDNLADLRRYRTRISRDELRSDRDAQHLVLHALYVAVQASVDMALHVGADLGLAQTASYQDAFRHLGAAGQLDPELATRLTGWAGLRNVLAHFYPVVDYDRVHDALLELSDLEDFAAWISAKLG